jgi:hypothetical protein
MTGVDGSRADSGSVTAGKASHSTRTRETPSSATARLSATTAATGSPCHEALAVASGRWSADFIPAKWARVPTQPEHTGAMSSPVTTAATPERARAPAESIEAMRA